MSYRPNALVTLERLKTALAKIRDGITFLGTVVHKGTLFKRDEIKVGYDKIIRIVNTGEWVQSPLIFRIMQRGNTFCDLVLKFNGYEDSRLELGRFIEIGINPRNCVAVCSDNVCDIYLERAESNAYWSITDLYMNQHTDTFTITYPNEYYGTTAPSGTVAELIDYSFLVKTTGDVMTGSLVLQDSLLRVQSIAGNKSVDIISNSAGLSGLYDRTNTKWIIHSDADGNIVVPYSDFHSGNIIMRNSSITKGTAPTSNQTRYLYVTDGQTMGTAAENLQGLLQFTVNTSGTSTGYFRVYRWTAGSSHYADIFIQMSNAGAPNAYFRYNNGTTYTYELWHAGHATAKALYANASNNNTITITDVYCHGFLSSSSKNLHFFIPYNVIGGTPKVTALTLTARLAAGGYPYVRSGTSGATYTAVQSALSMWSNSASVRTGEVSSITIAVKPRQGFNVAVTLGYALCSTNTGTVATNNQVMNFQVTATITLT